MPIKYNLTKFDKIAERIQSVAAKENQGSPGDYIPTEEEEMIKIEAVIMTALCSSFSYQTSKSITDGAVDLGNEMIKEDHRLAREGRWKRLRNLYIQEVASMSINDSNFYQWLHYNVNKEEQELYKRAWENLKMKFNEACDEVDAESIRY
jgi:NADH:ubiquinone oxidoreductase subunit